MDFGTIELDIADVDKLVEKQIKILEDIYIKLIDYDCDSIRPEILLVIENLKKILK